ncbi:MAG: tetratricopeptide repeat protein [Burkholderiales bacterium]|nr:tetratricopeptide repeat protein [Burkholderiales bacterium]
MPATPRQCSWMPVLLFALTTALPAQARLLENPQWRAMLDGGKFADLERAAKARLAREPVDGDIAVALMLSAIDANDGQRIDAAADLAQQCADRLPQSARCQYALGTSLGVQALRSGLLRAMRSAGRIHDALLRAVELDPLFYEARGALQQFYLAAPGIAGGSADKARELARAADPRQPEHAKLLRATVALHDKRVADAERELAGLRPGDDTSLQGDLRQAWMAVGARHLEDKHPAQARAAFETVQRDFPAHALGPYGSSRVALDQGQWDDAIRLLERARGMDGADRLPIDHRLGQAYAGKGDKAQARAAWERFIAGAKDGRTNPRNLDDAKKRLAELG